MKKTLIMLVICLPLILSACTGQESQTSSAVTEPTTMPSTTQAAETAATTSLTVPTTTMTTTAAATTTTAMTEPTTTENLIHELTGTFLGAEWGDYLHVSIKGDDDQEYSFFVIKYPGVEIETLSVGQKVKVTWKNSDEYLDPPGDTINIDQIISIELLS